MAAIFVWLATLIDVDCCSLKLKVVVLEHSLDQKNRAVGIRHLNPLSKRFHLVKVDKLVSLLSKTNLKQANSYFCSINRRQTKGLSKLCHYYPKLPIHLRFGLQFAEIVLLYQNLRTSVYSPS